MNPCVLIVDDDERYVELLEYNLAEHGYHVVTTTHPAQAIEIASREHPHVAILDVMMPEMDGFALARALMRLPEVGKMPIIFLTAKGKGGDRLEGFEVGAVDYLTKPFLSTDLIARIEKVLRIYRKSEVSSEE
jgi:DNA-binding response OmpR family regulator